MAVDKFVDSTQLDADLTSIANAIRAKTGKSENISLPSGLASAVSEIQTTGKEFITGSFTVASNAQTHRLSFGKTFNKYLAYIEMSDSSKTALINSGSTLYLGFAFVGSYPASSINGTSQEYKAISQYRPSSNNTSSSIPANGPTFASSYIENSVVNVGSAQSTDTAKFLAGYTYNYCVVSTA